MPPRKLTSAPSHNQTALFDDDDASIPAVKRPRLRVFAFGSNLDESQMRSRCPSARLLGTATLPGHALAFAGYSASRGGPVATVFACDGLEVPGALFSVTPGDLAVLDRYEGVPWMYERSFAWVLTASCQRRRAAIYRLQAEQLRLGLGAPDAAYLGQIVAAYRRLGISQEALEIALEIAARKAAGAGRKRR